MNKNFTLLLSVSESVKNRKPSCHFQPPLTPSSPHLSLPNLTLQQRQKLETISRLKVALLLPQTPHF